MTLEEFRATGRDVANLADEDLCIEGPGRVYLYCGGPYIERAEDGKWLLTIFNDSTLSADIAPLEVELYEFARDEGLLD